MEFLKAGGEVQGLSPFTLGCPFKIFTEKPPGLLPTGGTGHGDHRMGVWGGPPESEGRRADRQRRGVEKAHGGPPVREPWTASRHT